MYKLFSYFYDLGLILIQSELIDIVKAYDIEDYLVSSHDLLVSDCELKKIKSLVFYANLELI